MGSLSPKASASLRALPIVVLHCRSLGTINPEAMDHWKVAEKYADFIDVAGKPLTGAGKFLGPTKKLIRAGLRNEEMDNALDRFPPEVLGALALGYQECRAEGIRCMWKGEDNLRAAAHLIHEKLEVDALCGHFHDPRTSPILCSSSPLWQKTSACGARDSGNLG